SVGVTIEDNLVQIEAHPPDGVVAEPVPAANGALGVAKDRFPDSTRHLMDPGANHRDPMRESANRGRHLAFGAALQVRIRMLLSPEGRSTFGVMRQPVLI